MSLRMAKVESQDATAIEGQMSTVVRVLSVRETNLYRPIEVTQEQEQIHALRSLHEKVTECELSDIVITHSDYFAGIRPSMLLMNNVPVPPGSGKMPVLGGGGGEPAVHVRVYRHVLRPEQGKELAVPVREVPGRGEKLLTGGSSRNRCRRDTKGTEGSAGSGNGEKTNRLMLFISCAGVFLFPLGKARESRRRSRTVGLRRTRDVMCRELFCASLP
jgi:hypothetical protein